MNDAEAHGRFLSTSHLSQQEIAHRVRNGTFWNDDSKTFIIKLKRDLTRIGVIHYWFRPEDRQVATYSVQIALPEQRNLGYGTEAQLSVIQMLFTQSRINAVEIYTDTENLPERRVLEKLGFRIRQTETYRDLDIERTGHLFCLHRDVYNKMGTFL
jgi:RimJ/RimL family protein N-acetyltransferase